MLALQAVTPEDLVRAVPEVSLGEARKIVAAVHRGEPVVASSAVRRSAARAVIAAGHVPALTVVAETLANLDAVLQAIRVFSEPCALGIDARAITVCTAGLPVGIRRLAAEAPRVRLAISLSSAIAAHRRAVMPIALRHDLEDVLAA